MVVAHAQFLTHFLTETSKYVRLALSPDLATRMTEQPTSYLDQR